MARAVAQQNKRQPVRLHIGAARRRLRRVRREPGLRPRKGGKRGLQLFVLKRLSAAQEKHQTQRQPCKLRPAAQQLVQQMLRRFPPLLQPHQKRLCPCQLRRCGLMAVRRFGLKVGQCEIHGLLRKRDCLLLQLHAGFLFRLQPQLHAHGVQVAVREAAVRDHTVNARG